MYQGADTVSPPLVAGKDKQEQDEDASIAPRDKKARLEQMLALIRKRGGESVLEKLKADTELQEARKLSIQARKTAKQMDIALQRRETEKSFRRWTESPTLEKAMSKRSEGHFAISEVVENTYEAMLASKTKVLGIKDKELVDALAYVYEYGTARAQPAEPAFARNEEREKAIFGRFAKVLEKIKGLAETHAGKGGPAEDAILGLYERASYAGLNQLVPGSPAYSPAAAYQSLRDTLACAMTACARHAEESSVAKLLPDLIAIQQDLKAYAKLGTAPSKPPSATLPRIPKAHIQVPETGGPGTWER